MTCKVFRYSVFVMCFLFINDVYSHPDRLSDQQRKKLAQHFTNYGIGCLDQHKITFDDVKALQAFELPKGKEAACFFACILKRAGLMNAEGKITPESVLKVAQTVFQDEKDLEQAVQVFQSCAYVNEKPVSDGTKGCDRSIMALQCLIKQSDFKTSEPTRGNASNNPAEIEDTNIGDDTISQEQRKIARIIMQSIINNILQLACTGFITATKIDIFPINILTDILPTDTFTGLCSLIASVNK